MRELILLNWLTRLKKNRHAYGRVTFEIFSFILTLFFVFLVRANLRVLAKKKKPLITLWHLVSKV